MLRSYLGKGSAKKRSRYLSRSRRERLRFPPSLPADRRTDVLGPRQDFRRIYGHRRVCQRRSNPRLPPQSVRRLGRHSVLLRWSRAAVQGWISFVSRRILNACYCRIGSRAFFRTTLAGGLFKSSRSDTLTSCRTVNTGPVHQVTKLVAASDVEIPDLTNNNRCTGMRFFVLSSCHVSTRVYFAIFIISFFTLVLLIKHFVNTYYYQIVVILPQLITACACP